MTEAKLLRSAGATLSDEQRRFVESGVVIVLAANSAAQRATQGFALCCRSDPQGERLTFFVAPSRCPQLLDHIRETGLVAAVLCRPCSHVTLQIKGDQPVIRPVAATERAPICGYMADLIGELALVGEDESFVRTVMEDRPDDLVAIDIRPTAIFSQTPGPQAGAEIRSGHLIEVPSKGAVPPYIKAIMAGRPVRPQRPLFPASPASQVPLNALRRAFDGLIPASIATGDPAGLPNVALISQVNYVDDQHVALSYQFFNKTRANILANGDASVQVLDPQTGAVFRLYVRYLRTETEGPIYESMKAQLAGIASHAGMQDVFRLLGADIFRVLDIEAAAGPQLPAPPACYNALSAARRLCQNLAAATDLAPMLDQLLSDLHRFMAIDHAMVLMTDESGHSLYTVASLGYDASGVGSEIGMGQGVIGVAARARTPIRIMHLTTDYAYSRAAGGGPVDVAETVIPLPGLAEPRSQVAVPITYRGQLLGVLFAEDAADLRFSYEDEDALAMVAQQLGLVMRLLQDAVIGEDEDTASDDTVPSAEATVAIRHYDADNSVFIDQDYLIKGVAGAIFWKLIRCHAAGRRTDFTNRELRLDPEIGLPEVVENLEARLILLQRRLVERCPFIAIEKTGRGRFRLRVDRLYALAEMSDGKDG